MYGDVHYGAFSLSSKPYTRRRLFDAARGALRENVPLRDYTSFHVGGPAALFVEVADTDTLAELLAAAHGEDVRVLILGGGTNLLIDDRGFDGLAIHLALNDFELDSTTGRVRVGAGVRTALMVERTVDEALGGTAFAAGLPGSVGGGLAGNAGCFGKCLGDLLTDAIVVSREGEIAQISGADWFEFRYRHSKLIETGAVLTEAIFKLPQGALDPLKQEADANIALRREKHPLPGAYTAGSFFKNLPPPSSGARRTAAGLLLDQVGAREMSVGDAAVFERHANIVINRGAASSADILSLTDAMRARVQDRFDVRLDPEVRYISPTGYTARP